MEGSVMGSKRLTPTRVGKMASKCYCCLVLIYTNTDLVLSLDRYFLKKLSNLLYLII